MTDEQKMMAVHGYMTKAVELAQSTLTGQPATGTAAEVSLKVARYCVRAAQLSGTLDREKHHTEVASLYELLTEVLLGLEKKPDRLGVDG